MLAGSTVRNCTDWEVDAHQLDARTDARMDGMLLHFHSNIATVSPDVADGYIDPLFGGNHPAGKELRRRT